MAANKRIRTRRTKTGTELARAVGSSGPSVIKAKKKELDREIHRLECYFAEAPAKLRQQRLRTIDMVPPMELDTPARRVRGKNRVPLQQQRVHNRRVTLLFLELLVVGTGITLTAIWLNEWFKVW